MRSEPPRQAQQVSSHVHLSHIHIFKKDPKSSNINKSPPQTIATFKIQLDHKSHKLTATSNTWSAIRETETETETETE
jgi:hypothetical protein